MSTVSDRLQLALTPASDVTKKFISWRTELAGDTDSNMTKIDSAVADLQDNKQDKLSGTNGQVVGFDSEGNAVAQDAPSGLPAGTDGQIVQYDADGNAQAVDSPFLPLAGGTMEGDIKTYSKNWVIGQRSTNDNSVYTGLKIDTYGGAYVSGGFAGETVTICAKGSVDIFAHGNYVCVYKPLYMCDYNITASETNSRFIKGVKTPEEDYDAANKIYVDARKPKCVTITLTAADWDADALTQVATVSGVLADETAQLIQPTPAISSQPAYYDAGIKCTAQAEDSLTFTATTVPTDDLTVYVVIQEVTA